MKLKETEIKAFTNEKDFNSSAINSISIIKENQVQIVFNNSNKEYIYDIIDSNFVESLENTITNKESVGKYIVSSIKLNNIQQINTIVE